MPFCYFTGPVPVARRCLRSGLLGSQVTGIHLLLEFADGTERHRMSHENGLLGQTDRQSARDPDANVWTGRA